MTGKHLEAFAHAHVPQSTGAVNGRSGTVLSSELKLSARDFLLVAHQLVNRLTNPGVPDDGSLVEGASENEISV